MNNNLFSQSIDGEEWRSVRNFEGIYAISNMGRLASKKCGNWKILSNKNSKGDYFTVVLEHDGVVKRTRIHRLVYESFVGEIPLGCKFQIHHINGDKQDNRISNLRLVTSSEHHLEHLKSNPNMIGGMVKYNKYVRPKKILQCDMYGNVVNRFSNSKEASDATGVCQRNILQVASKEPFNKKGGIRKQAGGYIWKFAE